MVEPIITTGAVLVGAGAWFADKLLGASAEALGEQLKVYASGRWKSIFERTKELADGQNVNSLPPGFAYLALQKSSFSEDDELITDLWANLLLNASMKFTQRHVLYVDILEKLSAGDAKILDEMIKSGIELNIRHSVQWELDEIRRSLFKHAEQVLENRNISHFDFDAAEEFDISISNFTNRWPITILETIIPITPPEAQPGTLAATSSTSGQANSEAPYDALIRQRLLQSFQISFIVGFQMTIGGVMATSLGVEFIQSCRGSA